ncbi:MULTISPECIES: hypothetical protein [Frankia]|uniref:hypothetical protein n=1 Tax=Frankia TaxID=1854 RepID=UPI0012FF9AB0|nr:MULTISPECIES: hypothetical protein [Frankia]
MTDNPAVRAQVLDARQVLAEARRICRELTAVLTGLAALADQTHDPHHSPQEGGGGV